MLGGGSVAVVVAAIPSFLNGFGMNFVCVSVDSFPCPYTGRTQNETTPTDPPPLPSTCFAVGVVRGRLQEYPDRQE